MRPSQFTENEILHLLHEANTGAPVAEICATSRISLRTFYRWRRRYGNLDEAAVREMRTLAVENVRLRNIIGNLSSLADAKSEMRAASVISEAIQQKDAGREQRRAASIAAEKCGGALTGRFASVRTHP